MIRFRRTKHRVRNQLLAKKFYKRCIVFNQLYRNPPELKTQKVAADRAPANGAGRAKPAANQRVHPPFAAGPWHRACSVVNKRVELVQNQNRETAEWDPTCI